MTSRTGFFSLEVRVDVDIVLIVNDPEVTAEGHRLETVPAQEPDFGGSILPPPLLFLAFCQLPLDQLLPLQLLDLDVNTEKKLRNRLEFEGEKRLGASDLFAEVR